MTQTTSLPALFHPVAQRIGMLGFQPIINSLLELDLYKLTMLYFVFKRHPKTKVRYAFKNRTKKVRLAEIVDEKELRVQLDHVQTLRFQPNELAYLRSLDVNGKRIFDDDAFIVFLEGLVLPDYTLTKCDGQYELEFAGTWSETILWETLALCIVNELYYRKLLQDSSERQCACILREGVRRFEAKLAYLKEHPEIVFSDFGTRRRFMGLSQEYVVMRCAAELSPKQFLGTSNVYLAMKYGVRPSGTMAHELFMVYFGIYHGSDEERRDSHNRVLRDWLETFGEGTLSVALTDTYGSDFFFRDMTKEQAEQWLALRQDSGDPIDFGERAIKFYERFGIDPRTKTLVFSDGLDLPTMIKIEAHFRGRIKTVFGWGTNLTNDFGIDNLSLVIKAIEACGHWLVKLSDNLAKATGPEEVVAYCKWLFGYDTETHAFVECVR